MSSDWNSGIVYAELTDVGMRRANNQDSLACLPAKTLERFETCGHLFVVADGMGAHAAGELASQMATERIAMQYFRSDEENRADALRRSVIDANDEIHRRGQSNPEFHNMGTTASSLVITPAGATIAHVGDSRVYRLRGQTLEQLTFDHSLVWEMAASGKPGVNVPKNVITRSLGPNSHVEVDVEGPFLIEPGDCFLICSDGLTGLVEDEELGPLMDCLDESKLVRVLVDLANLRGGPDNISLIVTRVTEPQPSSPGRPKPRRRNGASHQSAVSPILITAIVCLAAAMLLAVVGMTGPMVIAIALGVIAGLIWTVQWILQNQSEGPIVSGKGSKSPYRRYDARATPDLYDRLGETVSKLREAAERNNWMMDWSMVDQFQTDGDAAMRRQNLREAIRHQAEAIIETMNQLREQNNRAANETAIDH